MQNCSLPTKAVHDVFRPSYIEAAIFATGANRTPKCCGQEKLFDCVFGAHGLGVYCDRAKKLVTVNMTRSAGSKARVKYRMPVISLFAIFEQGITSVMLHKCHQSPSSPKRNVPRHACSSSTMSILQTTKIILQNSTHEGRAQHDDAAEGEGHAIQQLLQPLIILLALQRGRGHERRCLHCVHSGMYAEVPIEGEVGGSPPRRLFKHQRTVFLRYWIF